VGAVGSGFGGLFTASLMAPCSQTLNYTPTRLHQTLPTAQNATPPGAVLLNMGSLLTRITNGRWKSTLHRVTNPRRRHRQSGDDRPGQSGRRLSVALFYKPDYSAPIDVAPSCVPAGARPSFAPALASDLTRAGVLHKLSHLPPEEASRLYHEEMAKIRVAA
jgi:hypothetical protein